MMETTLTPNGAGTTTPDRNPLPPIFRPGQCLALYGNGRTPIDQFVIYEVHGEWVHARIRSHHWEERWVHPSSITSAAGNETAWELISAENLVEFHFSLPPR